MTTSSIFPGLLLGMGCDSAISKTFSQPFEEPLNVQQLDNTTGQTVYLSLQLITSSQELSKKLHVHPSASLPFWGFNTSIEAKLVSDQIINAYYTYLLVSVIVKNPERTISRPKLTYEACDILKRGGIKAFEKSYGPEYLSGVVTGGCYYGLLEIKTSSRTQQQEIATKVTSGRGWGAWSITGAGQLENMLREVTDNKEMKITVLRSGGVGIQIGTTLEEMIHEARSFPQLVANAPIPFWGNFKEYRNTDLITINDRKTDFARKQRADVLEELAQKYLFYKDYRATLAYVQSNLRSFIEYQNLTLKELQKKQANLEQDFRGVTDQLNRLSVLARTYEQSDTAFELPNKYFQPLEQLPKLDQYEITHSRIQERLTFEKAALARIGLDIAFEQVHEGYGIAIPLNDLTIAFWLPPEYPIQPPRIQVQTSDDSYEVNFEAGIWQSDRTISELVLAIAERYT